MEDWTEKYRPKSLDEVIGNERSVSALRSWANSWRSAVPKKRAVILSGKAGTGKTSSALALANDFGWTTIELNASDARNAGRIKRVATFGAVNETFDDSGRFISSKVGGKKLIVLDEADSLYERSERGGQEDFGDRGGKKAIVDTIKVSCQPIILIVNDYYSLIKGGGDSLKDLCILLRYYPVRLNQIVDFLRRICRDEGISVEPRVLQTLADRCKGDVRSAINDLQSISLNKTSLDIGSLDSLGYRDRDKIIFDAIREVFKTRNIQSIREKISTIDETPDSLALWIAENLPREYIAVDDLLHGYEALSKADVFLGRVGKTQNYRLWSYASDIMTGGVAVSKTHEYSNDKYQFPSWLSTMKKYKSTRVLKKSVLTKIGDFCDNSEQKSKEYVLPTFQLVFQNNIPFACSMKNKLKFTEPEVRFLLGEKNLHKLKRIMQACETVAEDTKTIKVTPTDKSEGKKEQMQQRLF